MSGNYSPDAVRALAYQLWMERGGNGGSPEEDWFRAEEILGYDHRHAAPEHHKAAEVLDRAQEESFPASDPLAVHSNDEPPVNAGDKWKAVQDAKETRRNGAIV